MTQINPPGYPLPTGELGEDDIVCQLVYLPDRPEYWQALLGALSYFATWKAWERDEDKRGKDAASNWREAFEMTMECWRMACLEDITDRMDLLYDLLVNKKDCCDDNVTYLPVEDIETDIVPNEGDPPETYGETAVVDWDEWNQYLCYTAHKYVDYLAHVGDNLYEASRNSVIFMGVIAAGLSLLAFSGIGLPIAFGLAATIVGGIILTGSIVIFDDSEDDIEAAREDIVCAIMQGGDLASAVQDTLGDDTAWDVFYSFIPYETALAIMYEGGNEGEYLPAELRDDCDTCGYDQLGEEDVYLWWIAQNGYNYDSETKIWDARALSVGGCFQVKVQFFTDSGRGTRKQVKIVPLSCAGTVQCGSVTSDRGYIVGVLEWSQDHLPFPDLAFAAIDEYRHAHEQPGTEYRIYFKLYETA